MRLPWTLGLAAALGFVCIAGCSARTTASISSDALRSPSSAERVSLQKNGYAQAPVEMGELQKRAIAAAQSACAYYQGNATIFTPNGAAGSGLNAPLPLNYAHAIVVECTYMGHWFTKTDAWIVLNRDGATFRTRGATFHARSDAFQDAADPTRFDAKQRAADEQQARLFDESQAAYRKICSQPPFTTGRVDLSGRRAIITCYAVGPDGAIDTSRRIVRTVVLH